MSGLKERLKSVGPRRWLLAGAAAVLTLACAASAFGLYTVSHTLDISAAERFRGGSELRFTQIAAFLPVGGGKGEEDILQFRQGLESKFVEQALQAPETGALYVDAYSGRAELTAATYHGTASVRAFGVGGDFFYFHPLTLRSGAYIAERDLMDDLVVLDEALAWRLFGGVDLTGLTLHINGVPFVVSGVVAMEEDFASTAARGEDGCLFMSFSAMKRLDENAAIDCYEIVLPDPISGYGRSVVEESFPPGQCDVVENTGRYRADRLLAVAGDYGQRSMRVSGVIYPYWENALRLTEDYAALLVLLTVLFALFPAVCAAVLAVSAAVRLGRKVKGEVAARVDAAVERRREQRYGEFLEEKGEEAWHS